MTDEYRTNLPMVRPEASPEISLEQRLAVAEAREEALRMVLRALVTSLRPLGFSRRRFMRCVREEAEGVPGTGPRAVQHAVLYAETRRVMREAR